VYLLESQLERACAKLAKEHKCILLKIQGTKGYPDRLLLTPNGHLLFVEFKRPGQSLRPLQKHILQDLVLRGFPAEEVDSVELFSSCLTALLALPGSHMDTKPEALTG